MNRRSVASLLPRSLALIAAITFATVSATSAHAQVWNEVGDAGDLVATAQHTAGYGPLLQINGRTQGADVGPQPKPPPFPTWIGLVGSPSPRGEDDSYVTFPCRILMAPKLVLTVVT